MYIPSVNAMSKSDILYFICVTGGVEGGEGKGLTRLCICTVLSLYNSIFDHVQWKVNRII